MSPASSVLQPITDRATHDAAVDQTAQPGNIIVIYVTDSASPTCVRTTPKIEELAQSQKYQNQSNTDMGARLQFYQMELTSKTAPMIKFGAQNTPIFICLRHGWCQTILGPDVKGLERLLDEQLEIVNKSSS